MSESECQFYYTSGLLWTSLVGTVKWVGLFLWGFHWAYVRRTGRAGTAGWKRQN